MIIINNPIHLTDVVIMKTLFGVDTDNYILQLDNRTSHQKYEFNVYDKSESPMYYSFVIDLTEVEFDEYEYTLYNGNAQRVSKGIIQIGLNHYKRCVEYDINKDYVFYEG